MMTSAAIRKALLALCSPSAAITFANKFCKETSYLPSIFAAPLCVPSIRFHFSIPLLWRLLQLLPQQPWRASTVPAPGRPSPFKDQVDCHNSQFQKVCQNFKWIVSISSILSQFQVHCHNFKWIVTFSPNISFVFTSTRST